MELAQSLVRSCVRSFYDTKHILVVDTLIIHSAHTRQEHKEGQQRPMNRTYYYIDYRATIDAIKWRVYLLNKQVQGNTVPEMERKEYFCGRCKSEWTQLEVLDKWDIALGFRCQKCDGILDHDPDNNRGGHEQSTKYHAQFRFITDLLPKIDETIIPESTFDRAMASQLKVLRDETNPANETAPVDPSAAKPSAVHGLKNAGNTSISVTLTASDGPTEAEIAADKALKEKNAIQNAMPVHFTHSTITGEQVKFNQGSSHASSLETDKKNTDSNAPSADGDGAEIDSYFARLRAEQAKEAEREQEEEEDSDEEEEEDFEDVVPTGSGAATPSFNAESKPTLALPATGLASALKKGGSVSGSGTSTGATTPVTGPGTPNDDGRPAKRVRIEEPTVKDEDESEEDMEFEDV
ncbi:TFIIE alpha subunit [Diplocarpon rosae]|nr:TFIIE alpha subunit [Diplocarpon rosae]